MNYLSWNNSERSSYEADFRTQEAAEALASHSVFCLLTSVFFDTAFAKSALASFENEVFLEKMRVIEVRTANHLNGVMPSLPHAADGRNAHWKQQEGLYSL